MILVVIGLQSPESEATLHIIKLKQESMVHCYIESLFYALPPSSIRGHSIFSLFIMTYYLVPSALHQRTLHLSTLHNELIS